MKKGVITKEAFQKYKKGHPWLTADDLVQKSGLPSRPSVHYLGDYWWMFSPKSFLRLRRLGPLQPGWMKNASFNTLTNADQFEKYFGAWMSEHFESVLLRKIKLLKLKNKERCLRWIFSENDLLPGLIVDVFDTVLVAQLNSAPVETFWLPIKKALAAAYEKVFHQNAQVVELRNATIRQKEGLEIIEPEAAKPKSIYWNGFYWLMTPAQAQKTGAYFDQRENHTRAAQLAKLKGYKTAWDLCSYQGGFSLPLLAQGLSVLAVDQSTHALNTANENVRSNQLNERKFETVCADIFDWLRRQVAENYSAELIILDPPSFVKSRTEVKSALKGYEELNTLALRCIRPGGMLVSCVCSHHISIENFSETLKRAAARAQKVINILETHGPSPDHTPALEFSEGKYLQAWYLQVDNPIEASR